MIKKGIWLRYTLDDCDTRIKTFTKEGNVYHFGPRGVVSVAVYVVGLVCALH